MPPNVLKDCVFQHFCALILIFFLIFHHENVRSHAWPFAWAGMIFFARFWCFLAWKYVVFMTKNSVFTWFFRSKRIKALCFFIIFAWFFEWEKKFRRNRSRECRWRFSTQFEVSFSCFWIFFVEFLLLVWSPCTYERSIFRLKCLCFLK